MFNLSLTAACELVNPNLKDVLEFGVFTGGTLEVLCREFSGRCGYKQVYGFDSFEGLPVNWADLPKGTFGTEGEVPISILNLLVYYPNLTIFKGWFNSSLQTYKKIASPIGLLHIDCDIYQSAKEVLFELNDYIISDTIIVFDEWCYGQNNTRNTSDEQRAFFEWIDQFQRTHTFYEQLEPQRMVVKIL
jgi:hypothetical protein